MPDRVRRTRAARPRMRSSRRASRSGWGVPQGAEVVRRCPHVHCPHVARQPEAVQQRAAGDDGQQPVGPLVEVHRGVQATRLLHPVAAVPVGCQQVPSAGLRGEEPEGVEVGTADRMRFHHLVGAGPTEPQRIRRVPSVLGAVDHCPFVQTEAAELGRGGLRSGQQPADEMDGVPAVAQEGSGVGAHRGACAGRTGGANAVEPPARPLPGIQQRDAGTRMPASELGWPQSVVAEEEVLDRMGTLLGRPCQVIPGQRVDFRLMVRLHFQPRTGIEQRGPDFGRHRVGLLSAVRFAHRGSARCNFSHSAPPGEDSRRSAHHHCPHFGGCFRPSPTKR